MLRETQLLQASLAGDRDAFERIVQEYQSIVCAITFSGTGRVETSEELAQETFVNAWANLHQLRDLSGFRSWLCSIARNVLLNYHRRKKPVSLEGADLEPVADAAQNPPEILIRKEEQVMLEQAIMRLPEKYREPLVLFCRQGQSIHDAAEVLGLAEPTFRTRLHRARTMLHEEVARRLESVLEQSGPRKDFTKAVMVAVGGVPLALSVGADAAAAGGVSVAFAGAGVKVAVAAVFLAAGAIAYTFWPKSTAPSPRADADPVVAVSPLTSTPERADRPARSEDESSLPPVVGQGLRAGEGDRQEPRSSQSTAGAAATLTASTEMIVTGMVLDRNTLVPIPAATVGFGTTYAAVTDANGRFKFSYVPPKLFREVDFLHAVASGYAWQEVHLRINPGGRQDVLLKLGPAFSIAGIVVDPNQQPIENAKVSVSGYQLTYPAATTDVRGQFRIDGVSPDESGHSIHVEHPDFAYGTSGGWDDPPPFGSLTLEPIVLVPRKARIIVRGQVTNSRSQPVAQATVAFQNSDAKTETDHQGRYTLEIPDVNSPVLYVAHPAYPAFSQDVTLSGREKELQLDVRLPDSQMVRGRVVDDARNPMANADIGVRSYHGKEVWGLAGFVHSDANGYFTISAPLDGDYRIYAFRDGIRSASLTLAKGQRECVIKVARSGRVYGRVVDADTGDSIPRFRVAMHSASGVSIFWAEKGVTFTSDKGEFDTAGENLTVGEGWTVTVYADGYDPLTAVAAARPVSNDPVRKVFRLHRNARRSTVYVGRVVDSDGNLIAGAELGYQLADPPWFNDRHAFLRVVTDVSGTYRISSIDPQEPYIVFVRARGYGLRCCRMSDFLSATPGLFADIVLDVGATVFGHAWDENRQPLASVEIGSDPTVHSEEEARFQVPLSPVWPRARTDAQGYYQLTDLPAGEVRLYVWIQQGRPPARTVTLQPGASVESNFGDEGGFVIAGIVTDGQTPVADAEVELQTMGGKRKTFADHADVSGRFKLTHVPAGKYLFATLRARQTAGGPADDPNDLSHVLYEEMDIQGDLNLKVDYSTRSIGR